MGWKDINNLLENFKSRPNIKNRLKNQIIKTYLREKGIQDVVIKKGKLEIKVKSSIALQELSFKKEEIKKEINQKLKENIIKEVILRRG